MRIDPHTHRRWRGGGVGSGVEGEMLYVVEDVSTKIVPLGSLSLFDVHGNEED